MDLKTYREKYKIPFNKIAEQVGVSPAFITLLANKKRRASPMVADRIENITNGKVKRIELLYPFS